MKKIFFGALVAILSLTVILFSCQKPEEYTNQQIKSVNSISKHRLEYSRFQHLAQLLEFKILRFAYENELQKDHL